MKLGSSAINFCDFFKIYFNSELQKLDTAKHPTLTVLITAAVISCKSAHDNERIARCYET